MSTTVYYTATSLDGFIATGDHQLDWLLARQAGTGGPLDYDTFLPKVGALCMGANTYRWLQRELAGQPWPYAAPTWVITHSELAPFPGAELRFTAAELAEVHAQLAAAAGDAAIWIVGGGELAGQFHDLGLLDEVIVNIAPVTLGSGRPLLPRRSELELVESVVSGEFVAAKYRLR